MRRAHTTTTAAAMVVGASAVLAGVPSTTAASPPPPPGTAASRAHLAELATAAEGSMAGYSRERFPHWVAVAGSCNTREIVLKRDGADVATNARCAAVSGSWWSPYDGATWTRAADVDVDHMVPLAEAWRSGAASWTVEERRRFANDLDAPQLWAVTDDVNQAKGDKDPARWLPPRAAFRCTYARAWIDVKWRYRLVADPAEKAALSRLLDRC